MDKGDIIQYKTIIFVRIQWSTGDRTILTTDHFNVRISYTIYDTAFDVPMIFRHLADAVIQSDVH